MLKQAPCPECGTRLSNEPWAPGLCPHCSLLLALEQSSDGLDRRDPAREAATLDFPVAPTATDAPTLAYSLHEANSEGPTLSPGIVLGDRYRVHSRLGTGGMGEVWRAFDLKLRVDVALKALRSELLADDRALEALRSEVRLAREVISPNACRVYDLEELEGQELVSMEYIDGTTLLDVIHNRGPLELSEAREIASQFLAGLEAVHEAGLVHRDMKPENVMLTRAGRVVVMDFGIAKIVAEGKDGLIAGTPAYMPTEQSKGGELDARADVFASGVMLAEMTAPGGVAEFRDRQAIWEGIHQNKPEVPETPWSSILTKAVSPDRQDRYPGASALARALEEIALRVEGAEELHPYPGLSAFTSDDAKYFFGRELEIESMWKKLRRPHLLGLIGPSGAGKSSFVRAGLLPVMPEGWRAIVTAPGNRPFRALAQGLAGELSDDSEALQQLLQIEDVSVAVEVATTWRQRHEHGLLILDQFEELFTQNRPEVQAAFSELLARLALDADIHVLLSMRDDFLFHCSDQPALSPVFSELTPLRAPTGAALRRAVVQPALKCGYRFEDEALVEEILAEVEGERGALPMLAFACSRLWEQRDREEGLLTRKAYEAIGGVAGSLAHHAEATLERIGSDQVPVVRELFRNLVTAQATRASRTRDELLSVFGQGHAPSSGGGRERVPLAEGGHVTSTCPPSDHNRPAGDAVEVLDTLVDARLLTSYDVPGAKSETEGEEASETRVEIVHESLLSNWPRLVRWRTQDAEGAQLRDELRQSAELWQKRGHPEDLLWTGTSFKEYELWRERYGGGLTAGEEAFTAAMKSKAERRRRRRRVAVGAAFIGLLIVLAVVFASRQEARQQARRAEANQLLALGRLEVENSPSEALAYAIASLERFDEPVTRLFALEVLWRGPTAFVLEEGGADLSSVATSLDFSPDGKWLASSHPEGQVKLWPSNGTAPKVMITEDGGEVRWVSVGPDSDLVVSRHPESNEIRVWSIPDGNLVRTLPTEESVDFRLAKGAQRLFTFTQSGSQTRVHGWPLDEGGPDLLGRLNWFLPEPPKWDWSWGLTIDSAGSRLAYVPVFPHGGDPEDLEQDLLREIYMVGLDDMNGAPPTLVGRHSDSITRVTFHPGGEYLASADDTGEIRFWDLDNRPESPQRVLRHLPGLVGNLRFDSTGSRLAAASWSDHVALWNLKDPPDADPMILRRSRGYKAYDATFHPDGDWLATSGVFGSTIWPIMRRYPLELVGLEKAAGSVTFLPDGQWLASTAEDGTIRLWPMSADESSRSHVLFERSGWTNAIQAGPLGEQLMVSNSQGQNWLVPVDGSAPRELEGYGKPAFAGGLNSDVAVAIGRSNPDVIRVWDLSSGESRNIETGARLWSLKLLPDGRVVSAEPDRLRIWDLKDGSFEVLSERGSRSLDLSRDGRLLLAGEQGDNGEAVLYDLEGGTSVQLDTHGPDVVIAVLDPTGTIAVTVPYEGPLQVGPVSGGDVHLLVGGSHDTYGLEVSPDGRWIVVKGAIGEKTFRLWPMPDLSRPPLHTLPHDELLATLRSLTNIRAVADPESSTGWGIDIDPFPGWEEVPTW